MLNIGYVSHVVGTQGYLHILREEFLIDVERVIESATGDVYEMRPRF